MSPHVPCREHVRNGALWVCQGNYEGTFYWDKSRSPGGTACGGTGEALSNITLGMEEGRPKVPGVAVTTENSEQQ